VKFIANYCKLHQKFSVVNSIIVILMGIFIGYLTDMINFSDYSKNITTTINDNRVSLADDINNLYGLDKIKAKMLNKRIDNIYNQLLPNKLSETDYKYPVILGILLFFYVGFIIIYARANTSIETELREREKDIEDLLVEYGNIETIRDYLVELQIQVNNTVSAKIQRLEDEREFKKECMTCREILAPDTQMYIILNKIMNICISLKKRQGANLRIATYLPDEDGIFLCPEWSNDTAGNKNCVEKSFREHKECFRLSEDNPGSLVIETYYSQKPKIISNCETSDEFRYFDEAQKNRIRSILAFPIINDQTVIGVVTVDSDVREYFEENEANYLLLSMMTKTFGKKIYLEKLLQKHFDVCLVS